MHACVPRYIQCVSLSHESSRSGAFTPLTGSPFAVRDVGGLFHDQSQTLFREVHQDQAPNLRHKRAPRSLSYSMESSANTVHAGQGDIVKAESWRMLQLDIQVHCLSFFLSPSARSDVLITPTNSFDSPIQYTLHRLRHTRPHSHDLCGSSHLTRAK